jgi:single-strand DNA-binding protein
MSRGLNKVQIIGRLGADPEMRYTAQGTAVTNFRMAVGGQWTDRDGNERDDTEWFRVAAWDRQAEVANEYLRKGAQVYVEGRFQSKRYTDRDGIERMSFEVVARDLVLLGSRQDRDERDDQDDDTDYRSNPPQERTPAQRTPPRRNQPQPVEDEDDIPF